MSNSLLPPNATPAETALELATARLADVPERIRQSWSPEDCPDALLPWLAWAFSVDEWDPNWTEEQKRASIRASYSIHRRKGTIGAVRRALASLGLDIGIVEWFEVAPPRAPYTFRITLGVNQTGASLPSLAKLLRVIDASKNLRSHLESVDVTVVSDCTQYNAAATLCGHEITILPEA